MVVLVVGRFFSNFLDYEQIGRQSFPAGRFRAVRVFAHAGGPLLFGTMLLSRLLSLFSPSVCPRIGVTLWVAHAPCQAVALLRTDLIGNDITLSCYTP
jgi:hypothetical protein